MSPLKRFFSQYSKFQYQPRNSPTTEFNRLCKKYGWKKDSPEKGATRFEFNLAMKQEFNSLYGSDEKDINNWYKLCHVLKIDPVPNTLTECRAAVLRKHVNLVDLVHGPREDILIFKSEKELSDYTHETQKFFPKENAADGGVLRALRRHILEPRESQSRQGVATKAAPAKKAALGKSKTTTNTTPTTKKPVIAPKKAPTVTKKTTAAKRPSTKKTTSAKNGTKKTAAKAAAARAKSKSTTAALGKSKTTTNKTPTMKKPVIAPKKAPAATKKTTMAKKPSTKKMTSAKNGAKKTAAKAAAAKAKSKSTTKTAKPASTNLRAKPASKGATKRSSRKSATA